MTTFPSNRNQDDAPTMAAYFPPQLAWSSEQPEFNSAPVTLPARQSRYTRPPSAGLRRCGTRRRRSSRLLRCAVRLVQQHPGQHRRPERTRTGTGPITGSQARCPAGNAQPSVDVPLVEGC